MILSFREETKDWGSYKMVVKIFPLTKEYKNSICFTQRNAFSYNELMLSSFSEFVKFKTTEGTIRR